MWLSNRVALFTMCNMNWFLISIFVLTPFVYAETVDIGGGGQFCNADFTINQPTEWHYPLFPVPIAIDSRIGEEKTKMYIYAADIWNKVYQSFLKSNFREPQKYPQKLFTYFVVTGNHSDYKDIDKFFKNHDYEIKKNLLPFLMGVESLK